MARHLWQEDIEQRMQIRAAKDSNPSLTYNDLRQKFSVSPNIIKMALEKTVGEWKAMFEGATPRTKPRAAVSMPASIMNDPLPSFPAIVHHSESASLPASVILSGSPGTTNAAWEYRTIIIRSRMQFNDTVYEQQGRDNSDWKMLSNLKSFEDVLNMFGNDKWELGGMAVLNHGPSGFTGMYELVFKRNRS
jgi:hypothetical protein